jgi:hypothetical protein
MRLQIPAKGPRSQSPERGRFDLLRGLIPPLALAAMIVTGACEFQVLEPWDPPRWGVSLTLPLVNTAYELSGLVNDSTIFQDTTSREIQIEFSGALDTTSIDPTFLEVILPPGASPDPISEIVNTPDAGDFFSAVEESITVTISLDSLLQSTGQPEFQDVTFPSGIPVVVPQVIWNNFLADTTVEQEEGPFELIDTTTLAQDNPFIKRVRYVQLSSTPGESEFATSVVNTDFPTSVDSIHLDLASGPLSVSHETASLTAGNTFAETTDLASEKLGSSLTMGFGMQLPAAVGDIVIPAGDTPRLDFTIRLGVGGVDSLAITTDRVPLVEDAPDPLPLPSDIQITEGVLRSGQTSPINEIALTGLSNTLPFDIYFQLTFPNFDSPTAGADSLDLGPHTLVDGEAPISQTVSLSGYTFHNPAGDEPIEAFEYEIVVEVLEKDIVLPLDGSALGAFQASFSIGDLYFDSITGNFEVSFPTVPTTIDEIPTGFEGFQFDRLTLQLALHNEIDLPVELELELVGISERLGTARVPISAPINYPSASAANGDTAHTLIILGKNDIRTYWLPEGFSDTTDAWFTSTDPNPEQSIVDVLNLAPDTILVSGSATIEGEGTVAAGKGVWGEFDLVAPFAFVLPQDISFIPDDYTPWSPMEEDTREQIQTALLSASLTTRVENNFPIGGKISMLASDTTLFTLSLDQLDDIEYGIPDTVIRDSVTTIYDNIDSILALDGITGISHIVFYPDQITAGATDPRETRARRVDFYTSPDDTVPAFWIGRLFEMAIPSPEAVDELGHVVAIGDTTQVITLGAERVSWIASDQALYMKPFFTFFGATGPRTIQSTNSIRMAVFITFNLASDIFEQPEEPDTSDIGVISIPNIILFRDSTAYVDLDSVIVPPTGLDMGDLEVSVSSSYRSIATATVRTIRGEEGIQKVLSITGVGLGTAKITVSVDDDPDDDIDPAQTSFLVIVKKPEVAESHPRPELDRRLGGGRIR